MAKTPAAKSSPAVTASVASLPTELIALIGHAAEALKLVAAGVVALETAAPAEKDAIARTLEAANAGAEQSHAAIDAWFDTYVRDKLLATDEYVAAQLENRNHDLSLKLKAADDEAERELEEKRKSVAQQLREFEDGLLRDIDARIQTNTLRSEDQGGAGDLASPAAGLITVTVIGPAKGLRRCGHLFTAAPLTVEVTAEEKLAIETDPLLSLTEGGTPSQGERAALARLALDDFTFSDDGKVEVTVLGPRKGRRRAGFSFSEVAQTVSVDRDQLKLLLEDEELALQLA